MSRKIISLFFVFMVFVCSFRFIVNVQADGEAWLTGWDYRQSHTLNQLSGAVSNYQVCIYVNYGSGSSSGDTVYVDGNCETDFDDIRFTDNDGDTLLDYWLEEKTDSSVAKFWVEVADNLNSGNVVIYVYYGNSGASSVSDGDDTFLFFDDFLGSSLDTDKWDELVSGYTVEDGYLKLIGGGNRDEIRTDTFFNTDTIGVALHSNFKAVGSFGAYIHFCDMVIADKTDEFYMVTYSSWSYVYVLCYNEGTYTRNLNTSPDNDLDDDFYDYIVELDEASNRITYFQEDDELDQFTTNIPDEDMAIYYQASSVSGADGWVDFVFLRNFQYGDVTHGSWGSEEEAEVIDNEPSYADVGNDGVTQVGETRNVYCNWTDDFDLETCYFSTNNTGSWSNSSLSVNGLQSWANTSFTINYTVGLTVQYKWYCSDNASQWTITSVYSFETTAMYLVYYLNNSTMGQYSYDGNVVVNGTSVGYNYSQTVVLLASPYTGFALDEFSWSGGSSSTNPYNFVTAGNNTIWCMFEILSAGGSTFQSNTGMGFYLGLTLLFIVVLGVVFMFLLRR